MRDECGTRKRRAITQDTKLRSQSQGAEGSEELGELLAVEMSPMEAEDISAEASLQARQGPLGKSIESSVPSLGRV